MGRLPVLLCLVLVAAWISTWATLGGVAEPFTPETAVAVSGEWRPERLSDGRVLAFRDTVLSAPFPARVITVEAEVGQRVAQQQTLARLEAPALADLLSQVRGAQAEIEIAEQRLASVRQRERDGLATRDETLQGEMAVTQARDRLDRAWGALDAPLVALGQQPDHGAVGEDLKTETPSALARSLGAVRAPYAGVIAVRQVVSGEAVANGAALFTLEDLSRVYVEVGIPSEALAEWREGSASVHAPSGEIPLELSGSTPEVDPGTGLLRLRYIAENPSTQLLDGEWVNVTLLGPPRPVVWVPEAAVVARAGKSFCVVAEGERYRSVEVTAGPVVDGRVPVLSGLHPGQTVVTRGAYELLHRDLNRLMQFQD
jgi:multidrug efflux pump subunit AcrA (membrane-fusion protein)